MKNIVIVGGGVLGSQIAFQTAYCGFNVTIWLRSEGSIGRTRPKLDSLRETYLKTIEVMDTPEGKSPAIWARGIADKESFDKAACIAKVEDAYKNLKLELDLAKALADADIVIESMAEDVGAKEAIYQAMAPLLPEKTLLLTNSSTLLPSQFAPLTGRPEKYLALHFANKIWYDNMAEVMGHAGTDRVYFDQAVEFAKQIRMVPIPIYKEKNGYLLNSMLVPFLNSALDLLATGVSDVESIDKAWKIATGAPMGPFEILDLIGLTTTYNISLMAASRPDHVSPFHDKEITAMLKSYIDAGKLGLASGEGFYKY